MDLLGKIFNNNENKIVSRVNFLDYKKLGKFEKKAIQLIGSMMGLVKNGEIIDFNMFIKIIKEMSSLYTDTEKQYLVNLLFPEEAKIAFFPNFITIPVYTLKKTITFSMSPNTNGAFTIQLASPFLPTQANVSNGLSDIWTSVDTKLDGTNYLTSTFTPRYDGCIQNGVFSAYVLTAACIRVAYVGRLDAQSGKYIKYLIF
jgi:hypothetical protein